MSLINNQPYQCHIFRTAIELALNTTHCPDTFIRIGWFSSNFFKSISNRLLTHTLLFRLNKGV